MIQPAIKGGESIYGDGLAMAERLRIICPKSFSTLCKTIRRFRSIDDATGWHLEAHGPVIQAVPNGDGTFGPVQMIRHNDLDRLPDLPPKSILLQQHGSSRNDDDSAIESFYQDLMEAHYKWDELMTQDEFRLEVKLQPGDMVAVANQVCVVERFTHLNCLSFYYF